MFGCPWRLACSNIAGATEIQIVPCSEQFNASMAAKAQQRLSVVTVEDDSAFRIGIARSDINDFEVQSSESRRRSSSPMEPQRPLRQWATAKLIAKTNHGRNLRKTSSPLLRRRSRSRTPRSSTAGVFVTMCSRSLSRSRLQHGCLSRCALAGKGGFRLSLRARMTAEADYQRDHTRGYGDAANRTEPIPDAV